MTLPRDLGDRKEMRLEKGEAMRWPQRVMVEWVDVVFVLLAVVIVLVVTMEVWLPHSW